MTEQGRLALRQRLALVGKAVGLLEQDAQIDCA